MHRDNVEWVTGDALGQPMPVDPDALRRSGPAFLTSAFRAAGTLAENDSVAAVTAWRQVAGGSTGRKAALSVRYRRSGNGLPTDLFVKFSRDLDNLVRDRAKSQMEPEVRFAALSRTPGFPIAVPRALFSDYHRDTGTGLLITERIAFGCNGIEPQYHKCLDYRMPQPVEHYRALVSALARLAGAHRSGRLPAGLTAGFPLDVRAATVGERPPWTAEKLSHRIAELIEFAEQHPHLLPVLATDPRFAARLQHDAPRVAGQEDTILRQLASDTDYIALCHWNANVDNAWFWRDDTATLQCGLLDWGCVSQMNLGMALWGAMSGAETSLWRDHLDELLDDFVAEFHRYGGAVLDPDRLRRHTLLYAATMGVAWLLDVPPLLRKRFGSDMPADRTDPRISHDESLRAPLQMLCNVLSLWAHHRVGDLLDEALDEAGAVA
ncbi:hypothetical protein [Mycobacterium asiaticum]|uniref:hypothetical protein n=1 Tax=Mycobacterium asiaticum TaxID=1790 RepID=UPI000569FE68|nr:hypothetical protein [Mycobacterium asiaticum]OBJ53514.1 hypothetical protein A9W94_23370 [Mycobacterium asiaticum]ORA15012.1 hypothetical protein BST16_10355 [Mycobacterium asiaticum DSM 44297]